MGICVDEVWEIGVNVVRGDVVDMSEVVLFVGKWVGYVNVVSFCYVVRGLFLGVVDDVVRYRGSDNERIVVLFFELGFDSFCVVGCVV